MIFLRGKQLQALYKPCYFDARRPRSSRCLAESAPASR